jgi:hypothetical protein
MSVARGGQRRLFEVVQIAYSYIEERVLAMISVKKLSELATQLNKDTMY